MDYCIKCNNTGKYKKPDDEDLFKEVFNQYEDMEIFNKSECYDRSLKEVGYTIVTPCPYCHRKPLK